MRSSETLVAGEIYSRSQLREQFGVADATINTGIFQPPDHDSVWLFVTREKESDMTPHTDRLEGDTLYWQGQTASRKDFLIVEHEERGLELLVFYRESKRQYADFGFRYEGPFVYRRHSGSHPTNFVLVRARAFGTAAAAGEGRSGARTEPPPPVSSAAPCLVDVLGGLQQSSQESVVAQGALTQLQQKMHVKDAIEDWIAERIQGWRESEGTRPLLVVLSGNAGDGKSDLIERLRAHPGVQGADLDVIADATHAESPSQSQADRLVRALDPFASVPRYPRDKAPCVVLAINVGMVIAFFASLEGTPDEPRFTELQQVLHSRLGLSREDVLQPDGWDADVINLDHRNVLAGTGGGIFAGMLERLDPEAEGSITYDAARACASCAVRASCWVRTNLSILRVDAVRESLRDLLWDVSLAEDVHLTPRNLWDFLYTAITGGAKIDASTFLSCDWMREALPTQPGALTGELLGVIHRRLLYQSIFEPPAEEAQARGAILDGLGSADPIRFSGRATHIAEGRVRADPREDEAELGRLASEADEPFADGRRPDPLLLALASLTYTLDMWRGDNDSNGRDLACGVVRRARVTASPSALYEEVSDMSTQEFRRLLEAYGEWRRPDEPAPTEVEDFWTNSLIQGVKAIFGLSVGGQTYFRLDTLSPTTRYPAYVQVDLPDQLRIDPDPLQDGRASALEALNYVPRSLSASVRSGGQEPWPVPVDLQLYRLLRKVVRGYSASSVDLQAFFRLRYACERLGNAGAAEEIVFRAVASGETYRVRREARLTGTVTTFGAVAT